jgi:hypothetical protein
MTARFEARVEAAAEWLMSDDSAYEHNRDAALRAAREMLTIGDQIEARFEAACQRAIHALDRNAPPPARIRTSTNQTKSNKP